MAAVMLMSITTSCADEEIMDNNEILLDGSWRFIKVDSPRASEIERTLLGGGSIDGSTRVTLPHSGSFAQFSTDTDTTRSDRGNCYYFRKFIVPESMAGKRTSLFFEGTMRHSDIWVNGQKASVHYGYMPFIVDFKPVAGENTVAVKLDQNGAIYNNVWLVAKDSLSFTHRYEQSGDLGGIAIDAKGDGDGRGILSLRANVRNSYSEPHKVKLTYRILDHNGKVIGRGKATKSINAGESVSISDTMSLDNITLWDIDNPWLYKLDASISSDGDIVDNEKITFGFKDIKISRDSFTLNGRERLLRGVKYKQGYPLVGIAITEKAYWRDAYKIKRGGFNLVVPASTIVTDQFLDACDYYGLLVAEPVADSYSKLREDHPCLIPASKGNVVLATFGCAASVDISAKESALAAQAQKISQEFNDIIPQYWSGTLCAMFDDSDSKNGVMSVSRMPKFSYYFCRSQRDIDEEELQAFADPACIIASYWIPGESKGVRVFSNCHQVELIVDDVSLGRKTAEMAPSSVNLPHPSFYFNATCTRPGTLKAIGYDKDDAPIAECIVNTPGDVARLKLVFDESGTHIEANDIIMVHCYVLDANGNTVVNCDDEVEFSVTGTAQMLSQPKIKCEAGVATAIIRTGIIANDFAISARCKGMYTVADR